MKLDKNGKITNLAKSDSINKILVYAVEIANKIEEAAGQISPKSFEKLTAKMAITSEGPLDYWKFTHLLLSVNDKERDPLADYINEMVDVLIEINELAKIDPSIDSTIGWSI